MDKNDLHCSRQLALVYQEVVTSYYALEDMGPLGF